MREVPDVSKKRIELSVPQVAGSAVAAVVAAKLASYFGVYGTILGAGVVSAIATSGGTVFQHFFSRTGAQLREAKVTPKEAVTSREPEPTSARPGEFTEGTVYRARVSSWKRPVLAAALVFGVTMTGITVYELVSGDSFSGGKGTTVSAAVTGHDTSSSPKSGDHTPSPADSPSGSSDDSSPAPESSSGSTDTGTPSKSGGTTAGPTPTPGASDGGGTPTPTPSASATDPAPSASSRSGSGDQDPADPATP
ncbi:hypothetical protein OG601_27865 [Streptomyces sp. NBC_01239]|uniref:hypothetical protein n=1 Tax=Streptomyces sp. NBC_01239 TaxID=2903792 RepID=UPI002254E771|nr:hypothetical protein [Streptomyces sp. NBC_01239]MCX4814417.1 hypothetical protein [Streptomyces sp. NBC_01239]